MSPAGRRLVRYCVDRTEERHHLSGAVGRGRLDRLHALDWMTRAESTRAARVTAKGERGRADIVGIWARAFVGALWQSSPP